MNFGLYYLLHSTKFMLSQFNCVITYIPIEGNSIAYYLDKLGAKLPNFTLFHKHELLLMLKVGLNWINVVWHIWGRLGVSLILVYSPLFSFFFVALEYLLDGSFDINPNVLGFWVLGVGYFGPISLFDDPMSLLVGLYLVISCWVVSLSNGRGCLAGFLGLLRTFVAFISLGLVISCWVGLWWLLGLFLYFFPDVRFNLCLSWIFLVPLLHYFKFLQVFLVWARAFLAVVFLFLAFVSLFLASAFFVCLLHFFMFDFYFGIYLIFRLRESSP